MKTHFPYDPTVHTRDRLLRQIEVHAGHHQDLMLIGSLGRAAVLRSECEFHARGETPEKNRRGRARDIDLFLPRGGTLTSQTHPFPVDTTAVTAHDQRIVIENGDYWLVDELIGLSLPVDPAVFEPQRGCLLGELEVKTVSLQTHWALMFVIFEDPRKYMLARRLLERHIFGDVPKVIGELYQPFVDFHQVRRQSLLNQLRRAYRRTLPFEMRERLHPWVRDCKALLRR